ncbi:MAG: tRNA preQ1(34) S-adenosylmethionine ribosyltransferase-isomerase QueA [Candidatus Eisenbacteria bacterium]
MTGDLLDYTLPPELVAQHPPERREDARMLVVERSSGALVDARIPDLPRWLRSGDALVLNETRVIPARLVTRRPTGGRVELLLVRPLPGPTGALRTWRVLARPAGHAAAGTRLTSDGGGVTLEVAAAGAAGERDVRVVAGDLASALAAEGEVPLPPYIHRAAADADRERYQTVFARVDGAVAAPTAGLHFTPELLIRLADQGVRVTRVVLHVGPGTFRPISGDAASHRMDEEWFEVGPETAASLDATRVSGGRIVAVGSTSMRALESACDANGGRLGPASGWTRKYIRPPYRFQAVDALLTNFHLPHTTLLLLVAAFAGEALVRRAYDHAIAGRYRFYSYGDAMLVV